LLLELPYSTPLALAVALVPAALRWWWGRTLAPLAGDPVFPERLASHRHRSGHSFGVAFALLAVLFTSTAYWSLPLLMLSCSAASFQFRRIIYQETWGFGTYLSFLARAIVAIFGFWVLLAAMPALASLAGERDWIAALVMGAVLIVWNDRYPEILRILARATPIQSPSLIGRFTAVAQASTAGMPRFEQVRLGGGSIANAIALPSTRRSAVVFTDSLLARLDEDEVVAICGHEIAHLEYYNPERLRKLNLGNVLLIAGSVVTVMAAHVVDPFWISLSVLWPCVVVVFMGWRARHRQQHETDSDLRAVELTGNPEALASGLAKMHAYAHMPRRVDSQLEQHASHPSLARRLKAIRSAAPVASAAAVPAAAPVDVALASADGGTQVTLRGDRLEWREGDSVLYSFAYERLSELRLDAPARGQARLLVVENAGRRWEMTLAPPDVARAQAALDLIDGRLAEPVASAGPWPAVQRALTFMAVAAAIVSGQLATMIVALLAVFRPAAPLVAAAGAAMVAGAGLALRQPAWPGLDAELWVAPTLAGVGAFLLWTAWRSRASSSQPAGARFVAVLGILTAFALAVMALGGTDTVRVHQAARSMAAVVVWPVACAAALAMYPGWRQRSLAIGAGAIGLVMAAVGSLAFLDRFGRDPLLVPSEVMTEVRLSSAAAREFELPFYAATVRLSPGGVYAAGQDVGRQHGDEGESSTFEVGRLGHGFVSVNADDLVFLDDERVLTVHETDEGSEVDARLVTQPDVPVWRLPVAGVFGARLAIERRTNRWRIVGWNEEHQIVRARGSIGAGNVELTRWPSPIDRRTWRMAVAASETEAFVVETQYDVSAIESLSIRTFMALMNPGRTVSRFWHVGREGPADLGTSRIAAECLPDVRLDERLVCNAYDGTRTHIVALDPATRAIGGVGTMNGRFLADDSSPAGWLTGWLDSTPVALRLDTRELLTFLERPPALLGITASDRWLCAVSVDGTRSKLQLFPLPL
jgi:heat shock protein HtpX